MRRRVRPSSVKRETSVRRGMPSCRAASLSIAAAAFERLENPRALERLHFGLEVLRLVLPRESGRCRRRRLRFRGSSRREQRRRQMLGQHDVAQTEDDRAPDRVAQLAHVAGPAVAAEDRERGQRERGRLGPLDLARGRGQKKLREHLDLLGPIPQRRDQQREPVQTKEKVLAKPPGRALRLEVPVRRGDEANVDRSLFRRTEARHHALLDHAEELGLRRERQLADLVEKDGAAVRRLEQARPGCWAPVNAPFS